MFFGNILGKILAVNLADGRVIWSQVNPLAVWNSPLVHDGVVIMGGRDSFVYAFDAASGALRWKAPVSGPVLSSPAMDTRNGRVYVAAEDMRVYALDAADGKIVWTSPKLPGASFRGYYPVVAPDGSVMVTVTPVMTLDNFEPILLDMVKEIFGDFASWRHNKEDNDRLRKANFEKMADPKTYDAQLDYYPQTAHRSARLSNLLRARSGDRQTKIRRADRLCREHERHAVAAAGHLRRQGHRQVPGPAPQPL